jgi:hypothetical protein
VAASSPHRDHAQQHKQHQQWHDRKKRRQAKRITDRTVVLMLIGKDQHGTPQLSGTRYEAKTPAVGYSTARL